MLTVNPERAIPCQAAKMLGGITILYNGKEFKPYDEYYYVSEDGEIFSKYKNGVLRHYIDHDGYHRVDIHSKHIKVHKLVYLTWVGDIPDGMQINHLDDDKNNNCVSNLYAGTQTENISDCVANSHRVGHIQSLTVLDMSTGEIIEFPSVVDFIKYTGHPSQNGSLSKMMHRKWFTERFEIIERKGVTTIESYKSIRARYASGVENKAMHEASRVGQSLSLSEAQGTCESASRDSLRG